MKDSFLLTKEILNYDINSTAKIIIAIISDKSMTASEIAQIINKNLSFTHRLIKELVSKRIIISSFNAKKKANVYKYTTVAKKVVKTSAKHGKFDFKTALKTIIKDEQLINDYMTVRKNKKGTNTETAFNAIKKEIEATNATADECIKLAIEKNWLGFKKSWFENANRDNKHSFLNTDNINSIF